MEEVTQSKNKKETSGSEQDVVEKNVQEISKRKYPLSIHVYTQKVFNRPLFKKLQNLRIRRSEVSNEEHGEEEQERKRFLAG